MSWQSEFPEFPEADMPAEILALVRSGTLKDVSWHNDTCPSFSKPGSDAVLFVDYAQSSARESDAGGRYIVQGTGDFYEELYCGDDITAALAAASRPDTQTMDFKQDLDDLIGEARTTKTARDKLLDKVYRDLCRLGMGQDLLDDGEEMAAANLAVTLQDWDEFQHFSLEQLRQVVHDIIDRFKQLKIRDDDELRQALDKLVGEDD